MNNTAPITIRRAHPEEPGVLRIAALDSARAPLSPLLVAEVDGEVHAVLSLEDGTTIADPFHHTQDLVELLQVHATRIERFHRPSLLRRLSLRPRSV